MDNLFTGPSATTVATVESPAKKHALPRASVIIVNYNGFDYLEDCLSSVLDQSYPDFEIVLVENASTDGSADIAEYYVDQLTLVKAGENLGFAGGNNLGIQHATGNYLAFLNPDTVVEPNWLFELVTTLESNPQAGLATARILLLSKPDRINTCGNDVHFTGIPTVRGWMQAAEAMDRLEEVISVSGACFVTRRSLLSEIGGFDSDFFLYSEDNDLSWRAQLAGYRCLYVPTSVIYHRYAPRFEADKFFYLERNRYRLVLQNFKWRTLLLLLPALILSDVVTWGFAVLQGRQHIAAKLRVYKWFLSHWPEVNRARRRVGSFRRERDHEILKRCSYRLGYGLAANGGFASKIASKLFDPVFFVLYRLYLIVVQW
jgi:GT2 family glycosyltransferase